MADRFILPENRYLAPQALTAPEEQGAVPFFNLPQENQELAYVEGITDQYYDTRGKIEAYATDMWKKYGIDVTQPDYSQPGNGGGIPFKTYQKLATDLLMTANDLKISREIEKQEAPYRMSGAIRDVAGFDPTAQPINRVAAEERHFSTKLLPEVDAANKILEENVYTDADYKRFTDQVLTPTVANLRAKMLTPGISEGERQQLQFNIDALVQKPKTTPYAAFQSAYGGGGRKSTIEIDLVRKVTNLANAKWAPGSYTPDTDEQGNPVLVTKAMDGEQAGEHVFEDAKGVQKRVPRVLSGLTKKADGVYFTFKQEPGIEIPPVKVSSKAGDEVTASIISSNPKYGSVTKMYEAMREMGLADETGSLINEKVLAGKEFDTPDPAAFGIGIEAEKKRIIDELKAKRKDPGVWSRKSMSFSLPNGETVTFFPNRIGGGWYMEGGEGENLPEEKIVEYLAGEKYFNSFLTTIPGATPKQEMKETLDPVKVRAAELINKYKAQ